MRSIVVEAALMLILFVATLVLSHAKPSQPTQGLGGSSIAETNPLQVVHKLPSPLIQDIPVVRQKRQAEDYLKAWDINATFFDGEPVAKSSYMDCNTDKTCTFALTLTHTESVKHGLSMGIEMSPIAILKLVSHVSMDKTVANAMSTAYGVTIGPHSRARMMFRPRLARIRGRVVMDKKCIKRTERILGAILTGGISEIFNKDTASCDEHKLGPFEIIAPASSQKGNKFDILDGDWYVEYSDNPWPIETDFFQNFRDKELPELTDALVYEKTVGNPAMCAKLAKDYSYKIAVYYNATCRMKNTLEDYNSYTGSGEYINSFGTGLGYIKETHEISEMHDWVESKSCDLIEYDYQKFQCKKFKDKPKSVVMFRKSKKANTNLLDMAEVGTPIP